MNINTVKDLTDIKEVNSHLKLGWEIITTYTTCTLELPNNQTLHFVIGHNRIFSDNMDENGNTLNIFDQK